MNMPGFSAEASLSRWAWPVSAGYREESTPQQQGAGVIPQSVCTSGCAAQYSECLAGCYSDKERKDKPCPPGYYKCEPGICVKRGQYCP